MKSKLRWQVSAISMLSLLTACQWLSNANELKFDAGQPESREGGQQLPDADATDAVAGDAAPDSRVGTTTSEVESDPSDAGKPSDAAPAECLVRDGHDCDPLQQCGCGPDQHCQVVGDEQRAKCNPVGTHAAWSGCSSATQCPAGQTCDRGSCRPYCKNDEDCDGGSCLERADLDGELLDGFRVCWRSCDPALDMSQCADGTSCRQVRTPRADVGSYCAAPSDPCLTVEDGNCDEPQGTGACAAGSDRKDCCERRQKGDVCDLVAQCGCPRDSTCFYDGDERATFCSIMSTGTRARSEHCDSPRDCRPGLACVVGFSDVCSSYCYSNADCGEDAACLVDVTGGPGLCIDKCVRDGGSSCAEHLVCAQVDLLELPKGEYCWRPLADCSTWRRDGICQEATGQCAKGTDPEDCCNPPPGAGACDPFEQCGCELTPGTYCQADSSLTFACSEGGPKKLGESCALRTECGEGTMCTDGFCRKICQPAGTACGPDALCLPLSAGGNGMLQFGGCYERCDYEQNECPDALQCMRINDLPPICAVSKAVCPTSHIGNGVCDDTRPGGTRFCELDTDPDCTSP